VVRGDDVMRTVTVRAVVLIALVVGFLGVGADAASADYWGAYKWSGQDVFPAVCLSTGVNLLTGTTPYKHNVSAANSCKEGFKVDADLYEYNSSHQVINFYFDNNATDYAQAGLQKSTPSGDYWAWTVIIHGSTINYSQSCNNEGFPIQDCFST
jgi:hypothetical protein